MLCWSFSLLNLHINVLFNSVYFYSYTFYSSTILYSICFLVKIQKFISCKFFVIYNSIFKYFQYDCLYSGFTLNCIQVMYDLSYNQKFFLTPGHRISYFEHFIVAQKKNSISFYI